MEILGIIAGVAAGLGAIGYIFKKFLSFAKLITELHETMPVLLDIGTNFRPNGKTLPQQLDEIRDEINALRDQDEQIIDSLTS